MNVLGRRHETRRVVWAALGAVASLLCALAMIGNVTWAEETNWFLFAFAGFGVVGFASMALEEWQEWPAGGEPAWVHWFGAIFWAAFGAYQAYAPIYQIWITEADTNWYVVAGTPLLAAVMFWLAYREVRRARIADGRRQL